ncbi:hypothetical protein F5Y10DRAFT_47010 [Nemania abortiva]|nr:hypothetical protein F5Y10DRAFT_47010 [Nemania abortiva]
MTAVASPPTFTQHNRPTWGMNGMNGGHAGQIMNPDELNRVLMPRKSLQRNNSSSSIASASSTSSTSTVVTSNSHANGTPVQPSGDVSSWSNPATAGQRKRPQPKASWPNPKADTQPDFARMAAGRPQLMNGLNGSGPLHAAPPIVPSQGQVASQQAMSRPMIESLPTGSTPVLYLLSLNGTFERKTISVPVFPDTLRIGRQTNAKTVPTPVNGFFDSKVLSRQHAEIWADRQGKIFIRDVKSSNGTFVNGTRLSPENRDSEPHELQTGDHLELGIDIVSEDQKTVVHHKVAAKVEHAGYFNASNNLLDINFGDLDPTNGPMMMMGPQNAVPLRQRTGSQSSVSNGRMVQGGGMMGPQTNGIPHQRGIFFSPITTESIVKRLQIEVRNARLQSQDLGRTDHFLHALIGKEDIKDMERPDIPEPTKPAVNGGGLSFRSDNKTRFSDPPAPPPQQPLPEKPDIPSLKRGITERAKPHPQNISPIRHEGNGSQILQLTEALSNAKKEIESQTVRVRDLEEMLHQERRARELAEDLNRRLEKSLEEAASSAVISAPKEPEPEETSLDATFEPPSDETNATGIVDIPMPDADKAVPPDAQIIEASADRLYAQIESLVLEIKDLREELDMSKQRAETAESERDSQRKTLADMVLRIRQDTQAEELAKKETVQKITEDEDVASDSEAPIDSDAASGPLPSSRQSRQTSGDPLDRPTLSKSVTITSTAAPPAALLPNQALANSIPYASMIGVVLIGMGLMAYINGWQPQPQLER